MMRKRVIISVLAAMTLSAPSLAEDASETFSEDAAVSVMRRGHPLVAAATASVRAAEGNVISASHWTNPIVDGSYTQAVRKSSYDPVGAVGVGVTQFLELSGLPGVRRKSAQASVHATFADRDVVVRELEWSVRENFVHLASAYERRKLHQQGVSDLERATEIVRARVAAGVAPKYDASRIQIALEQSRSDLLSADADIARARGDLNIVVGPLATELRGVPRFDIALHLEAPAVIALLERARRERPDIVAARRRTEAASFDVDVAKRSVFPGIGVRFGAGYGQATGQIDLGVGVAVALPVFERGQGTIASAQARANSQKHVTDAITIAAEQRIAAAHAELVHRIDALSRFRSQLRTLSDGMRSEAEAGYREAKLSVLELVDAYQSLRSARLRSIELVEAAYVSKLALGRAVGVKGATSDVNPPARP